MDLMAIQILELAPVVIMDAVSLYLLLLNSLNKNYYLILKNLFFSKNFYNNFIKKIF